MIGLEEYLDLQFTARQIRFLTSQSIYLAGESDELSQFQKMGGS